MKFLLLFQVESDSYLLNRFSFYQKKGSYLFILLPIMPLIGSLDVNAQICDCTGNNPQCGVFEITVRVEVENTEAPVIAGHQMVCPSDDPAVFTVTIPGSGTYSVTVLDGFSVNYTATSMITLSEPDSPTCMLTTDTQSTCADLAGGSITVNRSVGVASITNINFPSSGTFYVYEIISSTPIDVTCRPNAETIIVVNPLPNRTLTVSDPEIYEEAEIEIEVLNSEIGVQHQLQNAADNSTVESPIAGNGSTIVLTVPATLASSYIYNVEAMNSATTCTMVLSDQAMVTINECDYPIDPEPIMCSGFSPCHFIDTNISLGINLSGDTSTNTTDDNDGVLFPIDIQPDAQQETALCSF